MKADQRAFIRIKATKDITLSVGADSHAGETLDIGQGGLCFTGPSALDLGPAIVLINKSDFVFKGTILAYHRSKVSGEPHFHFRFDKHIDSSILAVVLSL
ncbi:PilZ domain-containing protein [Turneriella parva]|uniref:Type IV pilus assembly PilZ n=1 Tax=Turneriella parva (strain ATCC BAA-1111 / DSM 21527 / NCTC 11395 / H) TaxID=869212 RepID=I4B521_TURPD|nr:PilZ domain-containing protein [Turneriella parva]AFM12378.1 type IV pilus assembly PilZ [Turneriella parva DSM 21527]